MTVPSNSSVPPFQSLGRGTVEHELCPWNSEGNTAGTFSLKALALKALERNEGWNKWGTTAPNLVPRGCPDSSACGTGIDANGATENDDLLYEFNERAAILEYEAGFMREEAERLANYQCRKRKKEVI